MNGQKNDFEARLSRLHHSLMNPLTVIMGYSQVLASREDLPEDIRFQASEILAQAQECFRIIEQTLTQAKAEDREHSEAVFSLSTLAKLLVVDDDPTIGRMVATALKDILTVSVCHDAEETMKRLHEEPFDAILLDMKLSGQTDGKQLFHRIIESFPHYQGHIIISTGGLVDEDDIRFLRECGCPCLEKPYTVAKLRETVLRAARQE